jgi:hypothetical protein
MKTTSEVSTYLLKRSEEDFGKCLFAFVCYKCGCGEGLSVFQSGTTKPILLIQTPTNKCLERIYLEALEKVGIIIPASYSIKTAYEILQEQENGTAN